jgi:hypothetical protein
MSLHSSEEARKTMLKMLGARLGMEGGCHPERAAPLRCLHEALPPLQLALPSLGEARAACNIPHEHEQATGAAACMHACKNSKEGAVHSKVSVVP